MNTRSVFHCNFLTAVLTVLIILASPALMAQENRKAHNKPFFEKFKLDKPLPFDNARPYYVCTWSKTIPAEVRIIRRLDDTTAIIEVPDHETLQLLQQQADLSSANDSWKLSPAIAEFKNTDSKQRKYIISATDINTLLNVIKTIPGVTLVSTDLPSRSAVIKTTLGILRQQLLPLKQIFFIDLLQTAQSEISIIGYNRSFHGLSAVDYSLPGANGKNITVGVKEQRMQPADLDLYKRVLPSSIAGGGITNHATVVSSIIGGAGNSFYDGRGIAYGCNFFPSSFDNLFPDDASVLTANRVSVQNHSYGTIVQQFYGAEAVSYDAHTWTNKNFIHVFSAGNQGTSAPTTGRYAGLNGFANLTGNFKMAKNVISAGAIDNKGNIFAESSAGPLYDGRIAPQLIALGPNGTSDAAAVVSGTVAVMQQVYADSNNQQLVAASLIKAILYNTTDDVHNRGIDYKTGYGLLNSYEAIHAIQQKKYDGSSLMHGQQWIKTIPVPAGAAQLKITLVWTDSAAQANNNKSLLNDLDLEVTEPGTGIVYRPWVLSSAANADSLNKLPQRKRDSLNTAEQISILLPVAGNYQVRVVGTDIINSPLPFHIAWSVDTLNTFRFTNPQHTSDVNRQENTSLDIRWRTFVADTNETGNLYISYNGGNNWTLIKSGHKIYTNYYVWPIKDTVSRALFRMQTPFGDFFSKEFVIGNIIRPDIDFLCTDSFGLSWERHIYAGSYKIYSLVDSAYLKHIFTVTDTFAVLKRNIYSQLVYAVEPVLTNSIPAARSIAFDITLQGVKCFYKTFYHVLQDRNELELILDLSAPSYTDSVYYELVTASGQLLRVAAAQKVNGAGNLYRQLVNDVPQGTSYWRARIRLKTGSVVYTEVIAVLTSGKRSVLFFPNPARRNEPLTWVLQQGVAASSQLQLFDAAGRMVASYAELPSVIDLSSFSPGMLIYKLLNSENKLIEAGKFIVRQ